MRKVEWHYIHKSYKLYFTVDLNIVPYGGTNALHCESMILQKINKHLQAKTTRSNNIARNLTASMSRVT